MDLDTRARRAAQGIHRAVEVREMSLKLEEPRTVERFDRYQDRKQRNRRIGAIVAAAAVVITLAAIAVASGVLDRTERVPIAPPDDGVGPVGTVTDIGTLTLTEHGCSVAGLPSDPVSGDVALTVVNETDERLGFDISKFVPDVITYEQLVAEIDASRTSGEAGEAVPNQAPEGVAGGLFAENIGVNRTRTFTANLIAGDYAYVCFKTFPGVGFRPYAIDGPFTVAV
jgi:hypothetical protein